MADRKFIIPVIRSRWICFGISAVLIIASIALMVFSGFNLGIDFESGLSQTVQLAPSGMSVAYTGSKSAVLRATSEKFTLELRDSTGVVKNEFAFSDYPDVGSLAAALQKVDGIECTVFDSSLRSAGVITGFGFPATLKSSPFVINFSDSAKAVVSIDQVRQALSEFKDVKVQSVGADIDQVYQIRVKTQNSESSQQLEDAIGNALQTAFGSDTVVVLETNFIGAKFSSSLLSNSLIAVGVAVALILVYVWMRFELGYALCSVLALLHDVLIMLGFIVVLRFEVSSTTIAAVLTLIGYSLNNTIVILDRVRSTLRSEQKIELCDVIDQSVTSSLSRTTISSVTTMLAIVPLCIFASGDIYYFAVSLLFGLFVGTYSSNFIAPALLYSFSGVKALDARKLKTRKKAMTDQESASYLMEDSVVKANAAKMQSRAKSKAEKKKPISDEEEAASLLSEDSSSKKKRSQLKLEK
ncbi:MAG: protein translocase subunit SecF [Sphaerochaetaceae bacterium]